MDGWMVASFNQIVRRRLGGVVVFAAVGIVAPFSASAIAGTIGPFGQVVGQLEVVGGIAQERRAACQVASC
jgi:hypothetical protein